MIPAETIRALAETGFRISEQIALDHIDPEFDRKKLPFKAKRLRTPLLSRKPLCDDTEYTRMVLREASIIPPRPKPRLMRDSDPAEALLDPSITVGAAMFNVRDRLTLLAALLRDSIVTMEDPDCLWGRIHVASRDLVREALSNLAVVEIGALEEHTRQSHGALQAA